jgi:hypothetical protein
MGRWRKDIISLTSEKIPPSFYIWRKILNFFNDHKDEIDVDELKLIVDRSEKIRIYLNEKCRSGIEQHDVKPNVYLHLENLKEEKSRSDIQVHR